MSRLAGDMKWFVVLGVYRSTVKKQNKEKTLPGLLTTLETVQKSNEEEAGWAAGALATLEMGEISCFCCDENRRPSTAYPLSYSLL